jgi:hypothetical protein
LICYPRWVVWDKRAQRCLWFDSCSVRSSPLFFQFRCGSLRKQIIWQTCSPG